MACPCLGQSARGISCPTPQSPNSPTIQRPQSSGTNARRPPPTPQSSENIFYPKIPSLFRPFGPRDARTAGVRVCYLPCDAPLPNKRARFAPANGKFKSCHFAVFRRATQMRARSRVPNRQTAHRPLLQVPNPKTRLPRSNRPHIRAQMTDN